MLEKILIPVFIAGIVGVVAWLARSLFLIRPKLEVRYRHGDGRSSVGPGTSLAVHWGYQVTITNLSKHDALEVRVLSSTNPQLESLPAHHIKGLDRLELEHHLVKNVERDTVVQAQHDFHGKLEPPELKDLALVLRYKNDSGFVFYTAYSRRNGVDSNRFSVRRPRVGTEQ